jgi:ribosomal protein S18 acetylase RimI-like enzyme
MKLIDIYYEIMNQSLKYDIQKHGLTIRYVATLQSDLVGKVVFDTKPTKSAYKEYSKILTHNSCMLNYIKIDKAFQGRGFGNDLMLNALNYIKSLNQFDCILLEALPVYNEKLDVPNLVAFYSKFGFELVKDSTEGGKIMKLVL